MSTIEMECINFITIAYMLFMRIVLSQTPNEYKYVNHIDSNKLNNSLNNLEWCTNAYNVKHCYDNGNRVHKNNTAIRVNLNGKNIGRYKSIRHCARELKLDRHKIARVLKGELPKDYLGYLFFYV